MRKIKEFHKSSSLSSVILLLTTSLSELFSFSNAYPFVPGGSSFTGGAREFGNGEISSILPAIANIKSFFPFETSTPSSSNSREILVFKNYFFTPPPPNFAKMMPNANNQKSSIEASTLSTVNSRVPTSTANSVDKFQQIYFPDNMPLSSQVISPIGYIPYLLPQYQQNQREEPLIYSKPEPISENRRFSSKGPAFRPPPPERPWEFERNYEIEKRMHNVFPQDSADIIFDDEDFSTSTEKIMSHPNARVLFPNEDSNEIIVDSIQERIQSISCSQLRNWLETIIKKAILKKPHHSSTSAGRRNSSVVSISEDSLSHGSYSSEEDSENWKDNENNNPTNKEKDNVNSSNNRESSKNLDKIQLSFHSLLNLPPAKKFNPDCPVGFKRDYTGICRKKFGKL